MTSRRGRLVVSLLVVSALAILAVPQVRAADAPSAEAKACKAVENHEPVDEGTEFAVGDTVWIWTKVKGAKGTKIKHVWKRDGKEDWSRELNIGGNSWVTNSRRKAKAGEWVVEVLAADGTKLTEVAFSVK